MRRFVHFADEVSMTLTCCGSILRTIEIQTPSGPLAMGYCPRCDDRRWYHDEVEVTVRDVLAVAAKDWKNTRIWKKPALQAV